MDTSRDSGQHIRDFNAGRHTKAWEYLGAHFSVLDGVTGFVFRVWAPQAALVRLVGDFNNWDGTGWDMERLDDGLWQRFVPGVAAGVRYKYEVSSAAGECHMRADPFGQRTELRPKTASVTWNDTYRWGDGRWRSIQKRKKPYDKPIVVYEVHAGSWQRGDSQTEPIDGFMDPEQVQHGRYLSYRELADRLVPYVAARGFTHIELMPVMEHPLDASWGYQVTGYYAPTARHGTPDDLKYLIDTCHQAGIGVILDWVPAHFPRDMHALRLFDGSPLFEYADARKGEHKEWGTLVFDYGKGGVQSFLISNALYWMDVFHADGLRVDAVSSMIYLNYNRKPGEWEPNQYGNDMHLEALDFLRKLNTEVFARYPHALMVAEESTAFPGITKPVHEGGLGFNFKWNMGWMNDTLKYMAADPVYRSNMHHTMTFSTAYAYKENYILSLSHDEVVHGKKTLLGKMSGDYWQQFANLRVYFLYTMTHPGKKLFFMGYEYGQYMEWRFYEALEFKMTAYPPHYQLWEYTKALNWFYRTHGAFWEQDDRPDGLEWIDADNTSLSIYAYVRKGKKRGDQVIVVLNMTPVVRKDYWLGVPWKGQYMEIWNSDAKAYGGSGVCNEPWLATWDGDCHQFKQHLRMTLPPLSGICFQRMDPSLSDKSVHEGDVHEN